jgi:hypothetical protein
MQCTFGVAPATLSVLPKGAPVVVEGRPAATVLDNVPGANIPPFGMCTTPSNPAVAAATAAAMGTPTPMPCMPVTSAPWAPGAPTTVVGGAPALTAGSVCLCAWGGVISLINPGALKTTST